jgi:hypothetical protein
MDFINVTKASDLHTKKMTFQSGGLNSIELQKYDKSFVTKNMTFQKAGKIPWNLPKCALNSNDLPKYDQSLVTQHMTFKRLVKIRWNFKNMIKAWSQKVDLTKDGQNSLALQKCLKISDILPKGRANIHGLYKCDQGI